MQRFQSAKEGQQRLASKISVVSESAGLISDANQLEVIYRRISRRVLLLFVIAVILNHIDRTNLAYAAITFNRDLGFGPQTYGLGSALFFVTFCIFQVPCNLMMVRVGIRRWLALLLVGWGCVASCFALVHNAASFFALRLLLGVFESGALPAMWWHLSQFLPQERLTKPYMWMTVGVLLAQILGGPLAAAFLSMDGVGGLKGWQWLFVLEGFPSVLMGVVVFFALPDSYKVAPWLSEHDKLLLEADMAAHIKNSPPREHIPRNPFKLLRMVFSNPMLIYLCFVGIMQACASHTFILWLPTIIEALINGRALGKTPAAKGAAAAHAVSAASHNKLRSVILPVLLAAVPYTVGAITAWLVAASSQKRKEVYYHAAGSMFGAGVFFLLFPVLTKVSMAGGFVCLVMVAAGGSAAVPPKTALVAHACRGPSQVVGMPLYNSISVIGGFVGPFVTGSIVQSSGTGFTIVAYVLGAMVFICGVLTVTLKFLEKFMKPPVGSADANDDFWEDVPGQQALPVTRDPSGVSPGGSGVTGDTGVTSGYANKSVDGPADVRARVAGLGKE